MGVPGGVDGGGGGMGEAVGVAVGGEVEDAVGEGELRIENWGLRILCFFYILTSQFFILKPSQGDANAVREPIFRSGCDYNLM